MNSSREAVARASSPISLHAVVSFERGSDQVNGKPLKVDIPATKTSWIENASLNNSCVASVLSCSTKFMAATFFWQT
jgi:hypothetical protein